MFGENRGELVLAEEHGQVCGVPPKLVGEPQDTEAGVLCSGRAECCCVYCKVLYLNEQGSWRTYRRIFRVEAKTEEIM